MLQCVITRVDSTTNPTLEVIIIELGKITTSEAVELATHPLVGT
jgi:hypothetical protein